MITEARKKARCKAQLLSTTPKPKPCYIKHKYMDWGTPGHAFSNKLLRQRAKKQKFLDDMDYAQ